jgi:hypothetical protein
MNIKVVLHDSYGYFGISTTAMEYIANQHRDALYPESELVEVRESVKPHRTGHYTRQIDNTNIFLHHRYPMSFIIKWQNKDPQQCRVKTDRSLEVRSHDALVDAVEVLGENASTENGSLVLRELELYLNMSTKDGHEKSPKVSSLVQYSDS